VSWRRSGAGVHHVTPGTRGQVFSRSPARGRSDFTAAAAVRRARSRVGFRRGSLPRCSSIPLTVLMLRREAEKHFATGYDGGGPQQRCRGCGGPIGHRRT